MRRAKIVQLVFMIYLAFLPLNGMAGIVAKQTEPMVGNTILEIKTSETEKFSYRAIVGRNKEVHFLVVEKFLRKKANEGLGQLVESWKIQDIPGGDKVRFDKGWYVSALSWNATGLQFKNESVQGSIIKVVECEARVFDKSPSIVCKP